MKLAHKKYSLLAAVAVTFSVSSAAQALTEYPSWYDGTFDSVTVEFGDLEWLRWDQTINMSINEALTTFESEGWRLATNEEMADLFNQKFPYLEDQSYTKDGVTSWLPSGSVSFDTDDNTSEEIWDPSAPPGPTSFIELFGFTHYGCSGGSGLLRDCDTRTSALFGDDPDNDGLYSIAYVNYYQHFSRYPNLTEYSDTTVAIRGDGFTADQIPGSWNAGVALVRDRNYSAVMVPEIDANGTMIALALLGGLVLVYRERRSVQPQAQTTANVV